MRRRPGPTIVQHTDNVEAKEKGILTHPRTTVLRREVAHGQGPRRSNNTTKSKER